MTKKKPPEKNAVPENDDLKKSDDNHTDPVDKMKAALDALVALECIARAHHVAHTPVLW